jgi:hypothetical protein
MGRLTGLQELNLRSCYGLMVSMRLRLEGIKEDVVNVSVVKPDLSEHATLREVPLKNTCRKCPENQR